MKITSAILLLGTLATALPTFDEVINTNLVSRSGRPFVSKSKAARLLKPQKEYQETVN